MTTSGQLAGTVVRERDCGVENDHGDVCMFVGDVDIHLDPEDVSAWHDCPECGARHDDGDPQQINS